MEHRGTKTIGTGRLRLRKFENTDAGAMYNNWACDPEVTKYLSWPAHRSVEISKSVLADWVSRYAEPDFYQWAIIFKENGCEPIGSIAVVYKDDTIYMVQVGYCIGKKWWGQGIVREALDAVIKFFFEEVGVNRIEARHDPENPNSGKVMVKCGMKFEGINRRASLSNQGIHDSAIYAILAEDYITSN